MTDPRINRAQRLVEQADRLLERASASLETSAEDTVEFEESINGTRQGLATTSEAISARTGRAPTPAKKPPVGKGKG